VKIEGLFEGSYIVKNSDGVGSKVLVAQRMDRHDTVAHDLIAMNADDTVSMGAEPFVGTNSLDIKDADTEVVRELMRGLIRACDKAGIAMVGGEIAELVKQVKGYRKPYIWNADLLGVLKREKLIDGSEIDPGDKVVALRSNGIRSNGLTLARKICRDNFGERWHEEKFNSSRTWGETLLKPSRICCSTILDLIGRYGEEGSCDVGGIAHITGGGVKNLGRTLPEGLGAEITDLFDPQSELKELQRLGPVSDEEAYSTWNMGQCFFLITPEPDEVRKIVENHGIDTKVTGEVTSEPGIEVQTKGERPEVIDFL